MTTLVGDLIRMYALEVYASELEAAEALGEERDEMVAEALAARARMLELERGAA